MTEHFADVFQRRDLPPKEWQTALKNALKP